MATPIPHNRARFTLEAIARATGGAVIAGGALEGGAEAVGVSTDTRVLERGAAFVALVGEAFDGHGHLEAAAAAGASVALVERDVPAPPGLGIVRVGSTLDALGALARAHARRWRALGGDRRTLAITGSAGKTTTRVALSALLARRMPGQVHATYGNLNNRVGAPMIVLGLEPDHRLAVLELGTNQPGEIAALAAVVEPEAAMLTLVAAAHVERLGSVDGVAAEKGALLAALPEDGVALGNGDDPRVLRELARSPAAKRITWGEGEAVDYRVTSREPLGLTRARVTVVRAGESLEIETPLLGEAGALASAAAVAAVEALLGVRLEARAISEALAAAEVGGGAGRLVPRVLADGLAVIDDSYNANPASSCASIRTASELARASGRRLVLVLGEMRELGPASDAGHDDVGRAAVASGAAELVAVAGAARRIAEVAAGGGLRASYADGVADAVRLVLGAVRSGDLVLVKGSRGVETERVVRALVEAHDATPPPARTAPGGLR